MASPTLNGKYRLVRRIGEGSMGEVFEAEHLALGTRVALKLLHPHLARRPGFVERVMREARAVARIEHPNVVRVFDVERSEDGAFMVMELVVGEPLDELLAARPEGRRALAPSEATRLMTQVLDGVAAAHRVGVTHRDLKPANIIVTDDRAGAPRVKILDFGIAKIRTDQAYRTLTAPGAVLGTPGYMSPEQAFGTQPVDARSDVFCLGIVFYELLTGRHPAEGVEPTAIPHFLATQRQTPLRAAAPEVPEELAAAIERALAPEPEDRFADAGAFRDAIAPASATAEAEKPRAQARPLVPPTIPASPSPSVVPTPESEHPGVSPSTAPTAFDVRGARRRTVASALAAVVAALALGFLVRQTTGRADEPQRALATISWPDEVPAPPEITTTIAPQDPASWPGGRTHVEGLFDGLRLEVTYGRQRDASGRLLLALRAQEQTPEGMRPLPIERADLEVQYYRTHHGSRRLFSAPVPSPLALEVPLSHDGKHHLVGTIVTSGRTVGFQCDLCLGPDARRCPKMRRQCELSPTQ